ncbi:CAP domain-containing protein [Sediminicola sp. 1XM1-17]|uniref:CAP domain-containing protein n=1 Tax=Sediminicola sp. 1XM1-17 TaxID=3127702 RepID=UPI0030777102
MKTRLHLAVTVLFVLLLSSCNKESIDENYVPKAENAVSVEQELLVMVNDYRSSLGYPSLNFSEVAYDYANDHTDYMIAMGKINHDNFSARASKISTEANASVVAENVAKDYASAKKAFDEWMASAGHRKNIEGDFSHTAVSVKKDKAGNFYFTQLFYK